jgi:protease IV
VASDIYSPFAPFSPAQRARLQDHMQGFYENFVEKAAESRKTTPEKIDQVAQGRVWTGRQAREHGLVDALGGLDVAVRIAKERAHIPADQNVELVAYPTRRTLFQTISDQFGGGRMNIWSVLAGGAEQRAVAPLTAPARMFRRGEPLALMPYAFVR